MQYSSQGISPRPCYERHTKTAHDLGSFSLDHNSETESELLSVLTSRKLMRVKVVKLSHPYSFAASGHVVVPCETHAVSCTNDFECPGAPVLVLVVPRPAFFKRQLQVFHSVGCIDC